MKLRERRKLETTKLIHETALAMARDRGVDGVTIEEICEAVGISQRTFFNYFPFKEAVFVVPFPLLPPDAIERFLASKSDLVADLIDLLVAQAEQMTHGRWLATLMSEIAETHPRLMPLQMAEFQKFEAELSRLIAQRLGVGNDDLRSRALAGAFIGANRPVVDNWMTSDDRDLPRSVRTMLESVVRTFRDPH